MSTSALHSIFQKAKNDHSAPAYYGFGIRGVAESGRGNGRESDSRGAAFERGGLGADGSVGRLGEGAGGGEVAPPRELLQMGESWIELPDDDGD